MFFNPFIKFPLSFWGKTYEEVIYEKNISVFSHKNSEKDLQLEWGKFFYGKIIYYLKVQFQCVSLFMKF